MAENLEKRQKAEQFRVLDEARIPTKPWKPKRAMILLAGIGSGLAVGAGAIDLAVYLDQAFHDPEDLEQFTALPVLATIPLLMTTVEQRKQRWKRRFLCAACLVMPSVTMVAVHFLWMKIDVLFRPHSKPAELLALRCTESRGVSPVSLSLRQGT